MFYFFSYEHHNGYNTAYKWKRGIFISDSIHFINLKERIILSYRKIKCKICFLTSELGKGCQNRLWY